MADTADEDWKNLEKWHLDNAEELKLNDEHRGGENAFQMEGDWYTTEEGVKWYDRTLDNMLEWHRDLMSKAKQPDVVNP